MAHNDEEVFRKLSGGLAITAEELFRILDPQSIPSLIKQQYDNLEMNIEFEKYLKEKEEKHLALIAYILRGITEYVAWQQTQEAQTNAAKNQQQSIEDLDSKEPIIIDSSKGWIEDLIKNMLLLEEHRHYHHHLHSMIQTESKENQRVIKAVLSLAAHSNTIRAFLFPKYDPTKHNYEEHCQLILKRILDVGANLKHIQCHKIMTNESLIKVIHEQEQTKSSTLKIPTDNKLHDDKSSSNPKAK